MKQAAFAALLVLDIWIAVSREAHADPGISPHPLLPVLQMAEKGYRKMRTGIRDYTCMLTKQERVDGRLLKPEKMWLKIRHGRQPERAASVPFSVYVKFDAPTDVPNREVLYIKGRHDGRMIVYNGGRRFAHITTTVAPDSPAAMQRNRYPVHEIGMLNWTRRLIERGQTELQYDDVCVDTIPGDAENGARINGRPCTRIRISHTVQREEVPYQYVEILIDDELQLPVYYASYDWPDQPGEQAKLLEMYVYWNIRLNVGLSDWDFNHRNEEYAFLKSFDPSSTGPESREVARPATASQGDAANTAAASLDRP